VGTELGFREEAVDWTELHQDMYASMMSLHQENSGFLGPTNIS
jgi:hypothetical protein